LHDWLGLVRPSHEELEICFDYQGDWELFSTLWTVLSHLGVSRAEWKGI